MAELAYITEAASPEGAAPIVGLIEEAGAAATAHLDQLPAGEEANVMVTLTGETTYGHIPLGMWHFYRTADNAVHLSGATEVSADG